MELPLTRATVRSWRMSDLDALVRHADNPRIATSVRDRFPHPYTRQQGREFLRHVREERPEVAFAIAVDGEAAGGIGFRLQADVERVSAEIGYWVAEPFWGRGIATEAVRAMTAMAIAEHRLTRVFALVFASNIASCRVLEKAGFILEARLRQSAIKAGRIIDECQYALIAADQPDE